MKVRKTKQNLAFSFNDIFIRMKCTFIPFFLMFTVAGCPSSRSVAADSANQKDTAPGIFPDVSSVDIRLIDASYRDHPMDYPVPSWSLNCGGLKNDWAEDLAVDGNGNVVLVGNFGESSPPGGDSFICRSKKLQSKGDLDGVMVKLSPTGQVLWAISLSGSGTDKFEDVATDKSGNIYVVGYTGGKADLAGISISTVSGGNTQGFLAKLDSSGTVDWVVPLSQDGSSYTNAIDVAATGEMCIAGRFSGTLKGGSKSKKNAIYVARVAPSGTLKNTAISTFPAGYHESLLAHAVASSGDGGCMVGGRFKGSVQFGTHVLKVDKTGGFLAKMNSSGTFSWAASVGSTDLLTEVLDLASAKSGSAIVTGRFATNIVMGATTLVSSKMNAAAFVAKINSKGKWVWAASVDSDGVDSIWPAVHPSGQVWIAGVISGPSQVGKLNLPGSSTQSAMLARVDSSGKVVWADSADGPGSSRFTSMAIDHKGDLILLGHMNRNIKFRGVTAIALTSPPPGNIHEDIWVIKLITKK